MKKSLLLSAAALATACAAYAQDTPGVVVWDFSTHGIFANFQDPDAMEFRSSNYDFIDKYGSTVNTDGESMVKAIKTTPEDGSPAYNTNYGKNNRIVSFYDGATYLMHEAAADDEDAVTNGYEVFPGEEGEAINHPFLGWKQAGEDGKSLGPARTIWMYGWGSLDEWKDENYNGATADDWVSTRHAISLQRCGQGEGSRQSYIQFPEVKLPCKVTYYIGSAGGKYSTKLRTEFQVVRNGEEGEMLKTCEIPDGEYTTKRMYKKEVTFKGEGKAAFRIWSNGTEIHLYHVVFDSNYDGENADYDLGSGSVDNVVVDFDDANAPVYNVFGQRVDNSYKGIVIKGGKKYVQK